MSRSKVSARMRALWVFAAPILAIVCGCNPAVRFVRETADGGEVVMPTNTNYWPTYYRKQAETLMRKKCPEGYLIDHEAAAGGKLTDTTGRAYESYFGYTGGSEAEQVYHITFHAAADKPPKGANARPPAAKPSSPAQSKDKDELPPPRLLPPVDPSEPEA